MRHSVLYAHCTRATLTVQFVAAMSLVGTVLRADPASTPPPSVTSPTDSNSATPTTEVTTPPEAETVIKVHGKQKQKAIPQSKASQTVLTAPAIDHADPDLTLPAIIARFVPGASLNPDNGLRIRGADDQFETYLDGAPVPQSVSGSITDVLDPKDIQSIRIYTGGFPAEFGNQLSGVFDITTRSGPVHPSGTISQSAATDNSYNTSGNYGGTDGKIQYFISASHRQTKFFNNPPTEHPFQDAGHEDHGFLKLTYTDRPNDSLTLQLGANNADFQNPGTEDTQMENGGLANLIWNHVEGLGDTRVTLYSHASVLHFNGSPDDFDDGGSFETNQDQHTTTLGIRADQTWPGGANHLFKVGVDASKATVDQDFSIVLPPPGGSLADNSSPHDSNVGLYIQDDWTPGRFLVNYGVRYDRNSQDTTSSQISPRINIRYKLTSHDTLHAYYDRLFQPVPAEDAAKLVGNAEIGDNGTLAPLLPESDDFYEVGIDHSMRGTSFGVSAYYKTGKNVRDDDSVGNTSITLPVDDAKAYFRGVEFTAARDFSRDLHGYANLALSWNKNAGPITGGLNEGGVSSQYFYDDHDQTYTSTFGLAYDRDGLFSDLNGEYGSGQPYGEIDDEDGNPTSLNYLRVPSHLTFNLDFGKRLKSGFEASAFANNVFNDAYLIKQITIMSNTQYAEGRVVGIRLSQNF